MTEPTGYEDLSGDEQLPSSLRTPEIERALARLGIIQGIPSAGKVPEDTSFSGSMGKRPTALGGNMPYTKGMYPHPGAPSTATVPDKSTTAESVTSTTPGRSEFDKALKEYKGIEAEKTPSIPEAQQIQQPPPVKPSEFKTFAGMAIMFAALAGHSSRTPMTAALNAFSGAIQGHMQGERDVAEKRTAEFKQKTEVALKNHQMEMDRYKTILNDKKMRLQEKMQEIHAIAAEERNQQMMQISRERNLLAIEKAYNQNQQAAQRFTVQAEQMHGKLVAAGIESKEQAKAAIAALQSAQSAPAAPEAGKPGREEAIQKILAANPGLTATSPEVLSLLAKYGY
jgi:hypothetical protein